MPGAMVTAKCKTCDTECIQSELRVSMIHVMFVLPWLSVRCEWQAVTRVAISNKNHNFISENNWVSHTITESEHTNNVTHRGAIGSNVQISSKNVPVFLLKVFQEFHSPYIVSEQDFHADHQKCLSYQVLISQVPGFTCTMQTLQILTQGNISWKISNQPGWLQPASFLGID